MRLQLLLYRQYILGVVQSVNDVLVSARNGKERPRMRDDGERQTIVEDVEQVLLLDLVHARFNCSR